MDNDTPAPPPPATVPEPTPEERALWQKQAAAADLTMELAKERRAQEKALAPYLMKQAGYDLVENPDGTYSVSEAAKTQDQLLDEQIRRKSNERVLAGLEGRLDIDPSVEADLARSEAMVDEELARRGILPGSGDIYNRAKSEFARGANALRYSVRKGEMGAADAIAMNRQLELTRKQASLLDSARGGQDRGASLLTAGAGLYGDAARPYTADRHKRADFDMGNRQLQMQWDTQWGLAKNQADSDLLGGGMSMGGSIIGAALLAGCWISEVLYGVDTPQTRLLRLWINTAGTQTRLGRLGLWLYLSCGQAVARALRAMPVLQRPVRWLFDRLTARAVQTFA